MTPIVVKLIAIHLGVYVVLMAAFALYLHDQAVKLYKDDRDQMYFWETRLPSLAFWLIAWEVTLPFTPWFYKRLVAGNQRVELFAIGVGTFLATLAFMWVVLAYAEPKPRVGFYELPGRPTPYERYCQYMKALDRTQPPHQQFYGIGCRFSGP